MSVGRKVGNTLDPLFSPFIHIRLDFIEETFFEQKLSESTSFSLKSLFCQEPPPTYKNLNIEY